MWDTFRPESSLSGGIHLIRSPLPTVLAVAALLLGTLSAQAETYYRWIDENGRPVHADRPPPKGIDYEVVRTGSRLKRSVEADEGAVPRTVEPTEGNDFEPMTISRVKIEKNPEYCARARENLEILDAKVRIQMKDENGEVYYLNDEDREFQKERARETIKAHCP